VRGTLVPVTGAGGHKDDGTDGVRPDTPTPAADTDRADGAPDLARDQQRLAALFATELCDLPPAVWRTRSEGATRSQRARIDDDETLADIVADAWDLARTRPLTPNQIQAQSGPGGAVVIAHGPTWTLIARSGGPTLILSDTFTDAVELHDAPLWQGELAVLVGELFDAAHGRPAFDETRLLPPPPLLRRPLPRRHQRGS
jgi:hypothetical protein